MPRTRIGAKRWFLEDIVVLRCLAWCDGEKLVAGSTPVAGFGMGMDKILDTSCSMVGYVTDRHNVGGSSCQRSCSTEFNQIILLMAVGICSECPYPG